MIQLVGPFFVSRSGIQVSLLGPQHLRDITRINGYCYDDLLGRFQPDYSKNILTWREGPRTDYKYVMVILGFEKSGEFYLLIACRPLGR